MTIDDETESVLRASFKVILGDQYSDEFHLCRLAGLVENRLLTLKSALGDPPNVRDNRTGPDQPGESSTNTVTGSGSSPCWADAQSAGETA